MLNKRFSSILILLIIALIVNLSVADYRVDFTGPEKDLRIQFDNQNLKQPLIITNIRNSKKGSVYFKSRTAKHWLRGKPDLMINKEDFFYATWQNETDKKIILQAVKNKVDWEISLTSPNGAKILEWGINIEASDDEYFTGLFERTVDGDQDNSWDDDIETAMNLRGESVEMILKHTLSLYSPYFISSRGYGIFIRGTWPGFYDLCREHENYLQIRSEGPVLNFRIYTGRTPAEIIKKHALDAGPPVLPPKWAFMSWRWRNEHTQREKFYDGTKVTAPFNSEVVEDVLMMQALDIPCGVYFVDRPWATGSYGYNDFNWDRERLPNPEKMIKWIESSDMKFLLWIAPWVMGDMADDAIEKGYTIKKQKEWDKTRERYLIDFTNPEAVKWWKENGLNKVLKAGVRGFKMDRAEELVPESRETYVWDGRTARENRNDYPVQYVRAAHEACSKIYGDDFVLIPRAGFTRSSKYGTFWGGDIRGYPEGLRAAIIAQLRASVMGYPFWGSDTCGYKHINRETSARWLAFSCFSPIMEVGPTNDKGFWNAEWQPSYDTQLIAIWRTYAKLRVELLDYIYGHAKIAHKTGMPITKPLFMIYPDQKQAWEDWQTYLFGDDVLVSPVWQKDKSEHDMYLPKGNSWKCAWCGSIYKGGQYVTVQTPLHKIPIFIKEDSELNLPDLSKLYKESLKIAENRPDLDKLQENIDLEKIK